MNTAARSNRSRRLTATLLSNREKPERDIRFQSVKAKAVIVTGGAFVFVFRGRDLSTLPGT